MGYFLGLLYFYLWYTSILADKMIKRKRTQVAYNSIYPQSKIEKYEKFISLTYFGSLTEKVANVISELNIKVAFKPKTKLPGYLCNAKDATSKYENSGVYRVNLSRYLCFYCPMLPLVMFSNKLYRYYTDTILTFWQQYPTVLVQLLCKTQIRVTGDPIKSNEMSILVMNHRTRTDWNYLWPSFYHSIQGDNRFKHSTKFLLKDVIKHVPGPGWVMQLTLWIFIKRLWIMDKKNLEKFCDYVEALSYKFSLLVFPEGTDFTDETKRKSDSFARAHNLQEYNYLLHPKTTGFAFLSSQLQKQGCLDAVYDLTIVYPDAIPQTEKHLVQGKFPREVKLHIKRYPTSNLPKSEDDLKQFLEELWRKKETILKEYHQNNIFPEGAVLKRSCVELFPALIFWTILPYITIYLLICYYTFRRICILHTIFLICTSFLSGGFQWFEISLYDSKKDIFGRFAF